MSRKNIRKILAAFICLLVVVAASSCKGALARFSDGREVLFTTTSGFYPEGTAESGSLEGPFRVVRVVDGDTIIVDYNGQDTRVRLIGVDTPESVHPDASRNTAAGESASAYTKALLTGKDVMLEFDEGRYDKYDRMLAYVYLDGEMVNATLIEKGYADTMTIEPNTKYAEWFDELADEAA